MNYNEEKRVRANIQSLRNLLQRVATIGELTAENAETALRSGQHGYVRLVEALAQATNALENALNVTRINKATIDPKHCKRCNDTGVAIYDSRLPSGGKTSGRCDACQAPTSHT